MRIVIDHDIGRVTLGSVELPGEFQSLTVENELELDKRRRPGSSGFSKVAKGFNDAEIKLQLLLAPDDEGSDPYEEVRTLRGLFYGLDKKARPQVYTLQHALVQAWGIRKVLFHQMKSVDQNTGETIQVDLEFTEYRPIPKVRRKEKKEKTASADAEPGKLTREKIAQLKKDGVSLEEISAALEGQIPDIPSDEEKSWTEETMAAGKAIVAKYQPEGTQTATGAQTGYTSTPKKEENWATTPRPWAYGAAFGDTDKPADPPWWEQ